MRSEEIPVVAKKSSVFEDVAEVLYAPAAVFDRTRNSGPGKYVLVTAAVALVIVLATKGLMQPFIDAQFDVTARLAAAKGTPMPEAARTFTGYSILAAFVLLPLIGPFLNAILIMIAGKVVGAKLAFGRAATIAALAGVPRLFGTLLVGIFGLILDPANIRSLSDATLSPARFFDPLTTSPALLGLLGNLDLFRIWQFILLGIGVSVVARVSRGTGYLVALLTIAIAIILTLLPTLFA